jgi:capsular polysaccharide biosynthesis protein
MIHTLQRSVRRRLRRMRQAPADVTGPTKASLTVLAKEAGWPVRPLTRLFLADLDAAIRRRHKVALLADPEGSPLAGLLRGHQHVESLHEFDAHRPDLHAALTAAGPFGVIVDDTTPHKGHGDLFRSTFLHTRQGGRYLIRRAVVAANADREDDLAAMLGGVVERRLRRQPESGRGKRRRRGTGEDRFAAAVGRLTIRGNHAAATQRARVRVKLRDEETTPLIEAGVLPGRVLETLPPTRLENRGTFRESPSPRNGSLPGSYDVPALSLRVYHDAVCSPLQVAWSRHLILPDTFRHNQRPSLAHNQIASFDSRHARTKPPRPERKHLAGAWFYLDSEVRGHYGHATTEQLSRLWAWKAAKAAEPELKALMFRGNRDLYPYETALYGAAGIAPDDLVCLDNATVTVERLYAATPMFSQPEYVHPDLPTAVWNPTGAALASQAPDWSFPKRVFVSRRREKRACANGPEVEALFTAHGFKVIFPEDYPLTEQARIFRDADVIAGYAGSGMFTAMLSGEPKHLILVQSESYTAKNEDMIAAAMGHRLDIAWCAAELPWEGRWERDVFHSSYRFDQDREGVWLAGVLADLP